MRCKRTERKKTLRLYRDLMRKNKIEFAPRPNEPNRIVRLRAVTDGLAELFARSAVAVRGVFDHKGSLRALFTREALLRQWKRLKPRGKAALALSMAVLLTVTIVLPLAGVKWQTAYAAVVGAKSTPTPTIAPTPEPTPEPTPMPTPAASETSLPAAETATATSVMPPPDHFAPGDQNEYVRKLQERLMDLDYLDIDEPTDFYGPATEYAVQLFQRQYGLQVDGIVGAETLKLLNSDGAQAYAMRPGNTGTDVEALQRRLGELNYYNNEITGYYGMSTEAAVRSFQERNGLSVDGVAGEETRDLIFSPQAKEAPKATPSPGSTPPPDDGNTTQTISSAQVKEMLAFAKEQLGRRYVLGTEGPNKFDCSGFVYYVLRHMGIKTGRYNAAGFSSVSAWTKITSVSKLQPGDLVFFHSKSKRVGHVAIYIGDGKIIHASSSKGKVVIGTMSGYFTRNFVCGRRVFK